MAEERSRVSWRCRDRTFELGERTWVMGILNLTPDSFYDGGRHADPDAAVAAALRLVEEGADLIDLGGESTRPGAEAVPPDEELRRVVPVLRALRARSDIPISLDTRKAAVARAGLEAGADIVNDVSALGDPAMGGVVRAARAGLVLMHMQGAPGTMQQNPVYGDVVREVADFLRARMERALADGLDADQLALDPGIGFGKTQEHNLALLAQLPALAALGRPLVLGVSRKSLLGRLVGRPAEDRLSGSLALGAWLADRGAHVLRVHDVKESCDALRVVDTMRREEKRHAGI